MANGPALNHRMSSLDASFLYLEQPHALLHVGAIFTFARPLPFDRLIVVLQERYERGWRQVTAVASAGSAVPMSRRLALIGES